MQQWKLSLDAKGNLGIAMFTATGWSCTALNIGEKPLLFRGPVPVFQGYLAGIVLCPLDAAVPQKYSFLQHLMSAMGAAPGSARLCGFIPVNLPFFSLRKPPWYFAPFRHSRWKTWAPWSLCDEGNQGEQWRRTVHGIKIYWWWRGEHCPKCVFRTCGEK